MRSALRRIDIVDKSVTVLRIGVIMLHCHLYHDIFPHPLKVKDIFIEGSLALIQVFYKFPDSALVVETFFHRLLSPVVSGNNSQALGQKRDLSESLF